MFAVNHISWTWLSSNQDALLAGWQAKVTRKE
jgi:hypothetical protein